MTYGNSNNIKDNREEQKQKEKMDNSKINKIKKNNILNNSNKIIKEISDIKKQMKVILFLKYMII